MIKKFVIYQNYGHSAKNLKSVTVSQNHYLNKILDVHPLAILNENMTKFTCLL